MAWRVPKGLRRVDLERALEVVPDFPDADPDREQYRTPAGVAAELLWKAHEEGAIAGRHVLDLGCGTGMFALGAALLGAASVTGVDVDAAALALARTTVHDVAVPQRFVASDVADWIPDRTYDTVVMNPPFGAQFAGRNADRAFYERAASALRPRTGRGDAAFGPASLPAGNPAAPVGTIWFLAPPRNERFLAACAKGLGMRLERVATWSYPIEARFGFHARDVQSFAVAGYRMAPAPG